MKTDKLLTFCFTTIVFSLLCCCTGYDRQNPEGGVRILYGNVITMKSEGDCAEAVVCSGGQIIYVGSRSEAEKYVTSSTKVLDYGDSYIYPGFMDAHVHGMGVGTKAGSCNMVEVSVRKDCTLDDYAKLMKKFIDKDFEKNKKYRAYYKGYAMVLNPDMKPHRSILDKYIPDVPVILETVDGHSVWVNTKTIEVYNIKDWTKRYSEDQLRVDADGYPTGYISEKPALELGGLTVPTKDEIKEGFKNGRISLSRRGSRQSQMRWFQPVRWIQTAILSWWITDCGSFVPMLPISSMKIHPMTKPA